MNSSLPSIHSLVQDDPTPYSYNPYDVQLHTPPTEASNIHLKTPKYYVSNSPYSAENYFPPYTQPATHRNSHVKQVHPISGNSPSISPCKSGSKEEARPTHTEKPFSVLDSIRERQQQKAQQQQQPPQKLNRVPIPTAKENTNYLLSAVSYNRQHQHPFITPNRHVHSRMNFNPVSYHVPHNIVPMVYPTVGNHTREESIQYRIPAYVSMSEFVLPKGNASPRANIHTSHRAYTEIAEERQHVPRRTQRYMVSSGVKKVRKMNHNSLIH